jgi:hypothetical protein
MPAAKPLRYQELHRLAEQFGARICEHILGPGIDQHDLPLRIDDDRGVRRRIQERLNTRLGILKLRFAAILYGAHS